MTVTLTDSLIKALARLYVQCDICEETDGAELVEFFERVNGEYYSRLAQETVITERNGPPDATR